MPTKPATASGELVIYTYVSCDTCRRATRWLREHAISFTERPIRETPPTKSELKQMLKKQGGQLTKLFNVAGRDYRELDLKTKLPRLSEDEALTLLSENGNLVKRPFLLSEKVGLVGFDETAWQAAFSRARS
jgi:arsenate reductase